ncbi:divergent polysaccharide deacetylase family protein [uncultured Helicobacter sp.]|uniref:divergent polysaccharide deacetylase family protein n=1 Tax=uncultured Helicobacter sp. TaxID=175537 RepID=UPI002632E857|nr:divergent polysaccharide deacetylase family protein [uncultured Helicobacter sp.]
MDKVKPLTIGIIALLLLLLSFNFIPKDSKSPKIPLSKTTMLKSPSIESNTTLAQNNAELIQKNIDFLKQNLEALKADSAASAEESPNNMEVNLDLQTQSNMTKAQDHQEMLLLKDYQEESQVENLENQKHKCQRIKPQLAIILDDIGTFAQYSALTKIKYKITPSLFPRSKASPQTPKIAKIAPFYMVHLPLEALNFYQEGHDLLFVGDSKDKIEQRIQAIKQDFPTLTYLNNHTGSKFTQNLDSMKLLLETLAKYKISFLDSKTASNTKTSTFYATHTQELLNPCQGNFLERDVFLDNELNIPKITQNLIQAVKIAKTKGYAIAIGHPHKETLLALKNAEDYLAKSGVEMVYINEIIAP